MKKITLAILLSASAAQAREINVLDLDSSSVEVSKFTCNREPMTPELECKDYVGRAAFNLDFRILEFAYWNNHIHTESVESKVKTVGWKYELGIHIAPQFDVFFSHHSRHVMESEQYIYQDRNDKELYRVRYPLEDAFGFRLKFFINDKPARSIYE